VWEIKIALLLLCIFFSDNLGVGEGGCKVIKQKNKVVKKHAKLTDAPYRKKQKTVSHCIALYERMSCCVAVELFCLCSITNKKRKIGECEGIKPTRNE
jgi:hypothetical protein